MTLLLSATSRTAALNARIRVLAVELTRVMSPLIHPRDQQSRQIVKEAAEQCE